jgi:hypothetical protein
MKNKGHLGVPVTLHQTNGLHLSAIKKSFDVLDPEMG